MIAINLLPWRTIQRQREKKIWLVSLVLGSSVAWGAVWVWNHHLVVQKQQQWQRRHRLRHDIQAIDSAIKEGLILRASCRRYQEKIKFIQTLQENRIKTVRLLDEMERVLPSSIYLTALTRTGNKVTLSGHALSHNDVSQLMLGMDGLITKGYPILTETKRETDGITEQEFCLSFNA